MDVVIHQAPGEARSTGGICSLCDQPEILAPVVVGEEDRQAPIAALGHMMRHIENDDACETSLGQRGALPSSPVK